MAGNKDYASLSLQPTGSYSKVRAEQIKSEDGFNSLAIDLEALRGQVKDIIGAADYKEEITGEYAKVQIVDLAAHLDASGASSLSVKQAANVVGAFSVNTDKFSVAAATGNTAVKGTLDVDSQATLASVNVEDLTSGRIVYAGASGELVDSPELAFDGTDLIAGSAKVSDLTETRVVFAGTAGALVDDEKMTFAAGVLTVSGSTFSKDVGVAGNLTVQGNFVVEGDTVTQNVSTVTTQDSIVTLNKDGASIPVAGAGIEFESGGSIVGYVKTNGAGDMLIKAATGGELTLDVSSAYEITVDGNLTVEAASFVNQDLTTDAMPTFTKAKLTTLAASRLMASNADNETVSADLASWIAGTANQLSVADDADGSVTLSLPQNIDTNADVEFDSLVLGDLAADAGKALKVGATGAVASAAWDEFVSVEANVGLELVQDGFKAQIGLAQDIRSTASPEFAALNLGAYGDLLADGSDFKIVAAAKLLLEDTYKAGSTYAGAFALAGSSAEWSAFETAAGGEVSLLSAVTKALTGAGGGRGKAWSSPLASAPAAGGDGKYAVAMPGSLTVSSVDVADRGSRIDVYLNGQMMIQGGSADYILDATSNQVKFNFQPQQGDLYAVVIR